MKKVIHNIKFKTFTLYAIDKVSKDYNFVLSVDASNLKSAKDFAKNKILALNRTYPHYHYDFKWEEERV